MVFPKWLYRKGDGASAMVDSQEHFDGMKDKHLWQETPWRPSKVKFCLECDTLKELVKNLEAQIETLKEDQADKDHTIKSLREGVKIGKGVVR